MRTQIRCLVCVALSLWNVIIVSSSCKDYSSSGCEECVKQSTWWSDSNCRWCELDNKCHAYGSFGKYNPCSADLVITSPSDCPKPYIYAVYSPEIAYDQVRLAAIPYSDTQNLAYKCIENFWSDSDFQIYAFIGRDCEYLWLGGYKECLASVLVSHKKREIVVAYRGSTSLSQVLNQIVSIGVIPKVSSNIGGEVQRYFKNANDLLYDCVSSTVRDLITKYPEYTVRFTGHSLGGAIASIASARSVSERITRKDKMSLYTFGMPKVGDRAYAVAHDRLVGNSWRVVHREDPVPHYPQPTGQANGPFHHRAEVYYPNRNMQPTDSNYVVCTQSSNGRNCGSDFTFYGSIDDHKNYFNIQVGTHCNNLARKKRSSDNTAWDKVFNNRTCKSILNPNFKSSLDKVNTGVAKGTGGPTNTGVANHPGSTLYIRFLVMNIAVGLVLKI